MANHSSSIKRIRQNYSKRFRNRYTYKSTKTFIKKSLSENIKKNFSKIISMIDKLSKRKIIHFNKASRLKKQIHKKIFN
ncbi:30S ribosomal protein S20 [Blattabacterium cuenoti]|uniref:30S ribosomal protein S20 n=1 Tax=Blattabacterium cuenoti TaxID=1653831 RepID=UPI00163D3107|nr:30S ribosomal protein S20 [Blattabacterium cuenoti]